MKNRLKNILLITLVSTTFFSCVDDLNVEPQDSRILTEEDFFKKEGAYKQALAKLYANYSLVGYSDAGTSDIKGLDAGTSNYTRCLWYMQEITTDEVIWTYENDPGTRELQRNIWTADNPLFLGIFSRAHYETALANNFLRNTTEDKLSSRGVADNALKTEIKTYRAEAKVLRSLAYYHLLDLFRKAAYYEENVEPGFEKGTQLASKELFQKIEADLKSVEADLANPRSLEYARVDKAVAWMILAKLYLNAEVYIGESKYTECLEYCNKIIAGGYSLAQDKVVGTNTVLGYRSLFMADNDSNGAQNEIIFPIVSDGNYTQSYGATTVILNGQVGSVEGNGVALYGVGGWGGALRIRKQFADKLLAAPAGDDRNTVMTAGRGNGLISSIPQAGQGYVIGKWSNRTSTGATGVSTGFVDTDFPMFRLADVYLMYAECQIRGAAGGNPQTALGYINALRSRAHSQPALQGDLTLDFILDERAIELHWEGHRRQDLIRFGKFSGSNYTWNWKANSESGVGFPAYKNIFPIPTASKQVNPNLIQNPNY